MIGLRYRCRGMREKRGVSLGLIEKLEAEIGDLDYRARECIDSRRMRLDWCGSNYCLLSSEHEGIYCSLQGKREGALAGCLRDKYKLELACRRP